MLFGGALHTFRGSIAPLCACEKNADLLQRLTPRLGAAVYPLFALLFPIQKQFSIYKFTKKHSSTLHLNH